MSDKLHELERVLPRESCSFCTHLSLVNTDDSKYNIKCVLFEDLPKDEKYCNYFEPEHSKISTYNLNNMYIEFLEYCIRAPYSEYKKSIHWKLFREYALDNLGHKCSVCGCSDNLDVVHINKKLGRETLEDVAVVCFDCVL